MVRIDRMLAHEEPAVRALWTKNFPSWPQRPDHWYRLNPTSVALNDEDVVVGARSVAVDPTGYLMHLQGLIVDPSVRGQGVADKLFMWEIDRGLEMGIRSFLSTTWHANTAMRNLFTRNGFHPCMPIPGYYKHNDPPADGILYACHIGRTPPQCKGH